MEMAYIQAENLKHKRTFTKTLMVLAPFVTALMNFFAPLSRISYTYLRFD